MPYIFEGISAIPISYLQYTKKNQQSLWHENCYDLMQQIFSHAKSAKRNIKKVAMFALGTGFSWRYISGAGGGGGGMGLTQHFPISCCPTAFRATREQLRYVLRVVQLTFGVWSINLNFTVYYSTEILIFALVKKRIYIFCSHEKRYISRRL